MKKKILKIGPLLSVQGPEENFDRQNPRWPPKFFNIFFCQIQVFCEMNIYSKFHQNRASGLGRAQIPGICLIFENGPP